MATILSSMTTCVRQTRMSVFLSLCLAICVHGAFSSGKELSPSEMVDNTTAPCDDFYQYACGNYIKKTVIPDGAREKSVISDLDAALSSRAKHILESTGTHGNSYEEKMKKMYKSCLDTAKIDKEALKSFEDCDRDDWPTMNPQWKESSYSLQGLVDSQYYEGYYTQAPLFRIRLYLEANQDPQVYTIEFMQPYLPLRKNPSDSQVNKMKKTYAEFAVELGADKQTAVNDAGPVVDLMKEILKISKHWWQLIKDPFAVYNLMTLQDMNSKYPSINWYTTIRDIIYEANGVRISPSQTVNVKVPTFFSGLDGVLKKASKRAVSNFVAYMRSDIKYGKATTKLRKLKKVKKARTAQCATIVTVLYDRGMAKLLAKGVFEDKEEKSMKDFIVGVKDAYKKSVNQIDWMDDSTRAMVLKKIDSLRTKLAIPNDKFSDADLNDLYKNYVVSGNFVLDQLQNNEEKKKINIRDINQPYKEYRWEFPIVEVSAFFLPSVTAMGIQLGLFQPPLYDHKAANYKNYAGVGNIIGHEIGHSIDSYSKSYDDRGRLRNWWTKSSESAFNKKASCFVDQYGSFVVDQVNMTVNGNASLGENIADSGGLNNAFEAYKDFLRKNGEEPAIPGLDLNSQQLFFLSVGQVHCEKLTDERMRGMMGYGTHSPSKYRVNGPLQNSEEFSRVFNCPTGAPMNPVKKCKIY